MGNEQNIEPYRFKSGEQAREAGRKGGIASGRVKRRRRALHEIAQAMLDSPAQGELSEAARQLGADLDADELTNSAAILAGQMISAAKGNTNAARLLIELTDAANGAVVGARDALSESLEELGRGL